MASDYDQVLAVADVDTTFRIVIAFTLLATLAVALRIHCRFLKKSRLGADDWIILVGVIMLFRSHRSVLDWVCGRYFITGRFQANLSASRILSLTFPLKLFSLITITQAYYTEA